MFDFLNFLAASVLAVAAVVTAWKANAIAQTANSLAGRSNEISAQATKLEADKHLIEWAQRVLSCASSIVSLRTLVKKDIEPTDFDQKRRDYRAALFALKEEGLIFFRANSRLGTIDAPIALNALHELTRLTDGKLFKAPTATYAKESVDELRKQVRDFIADIQSRLGSHWSQ